MLSEMVVLLFGVRSVDVHCTRTNIKNTTGTTAPTAERRWERSDMGNVITNGKIKIGAYHFSDRKRPALCVAEGNKIVICGYFTSDYNAEYFIDKLAECVGAKMDGGNNED
jgi:hypothetical protein